MKTIKTLTLIFIVALPLASCVKDNFNKNFEDIKKAMSDTDIKNGNEQ